MVVEEVEVVIPVILVVVIDVVQVLVDPSDPGLSVSGAHIDHALPNPPACVV